MFKYQNEPKYTVGPINLWKQMTTLILMLYFKYANEHNTQQLSIVHRNNLLIFKILVKLFFFVTTWNTNNISLMLSSYTTILWVTLYHFKLRWRGGVLVRYFPEGSFPKGDFLSGIFPNVQFFERQVPRGATGCNWGPMRCG